MYASSFSRVLDVSLWRHHWFSNAIKFTCHLSKISSRALDIKSNKFFINMFWTMCSLGSLGDYPSSFCITHNLSFSIETHLLSYNSAIWAHWGIIHHHLHNTYDFSFPIETHLLSYIYKNFIDGSLSETWTFLEYKVCSLTIDTPRQVFHSSTIHLVVTPWISQKGQCSSDVFYLSHVYYSTIKF